MPSWNELLNEFTGQPDDAARGVWLNEQQFASLARIAQLRDTPNVLVYASAFLQKPQAPNIQITHEDVNGFMSTIYGMDFSKPLTLLLHTPGGVTNAAETIVAYLRSKFSQGIEVVIPAFAMSAGTMVSLGSDRVWMGRQSQLGPIDPQMPMPNGRYVSAQAIVEQFAEAKKDITQDVTRAHAWAPVLQSLGPALLREAENALAYGERMVADWLERYMMQGLPRTSAESAARFFNDAGTHKSHGRRIDRDQAREQGIVVEDIETSQDLQDAVLTSYHLTTITFENSLAVKALVSNSGRLYVKNLPMPQSP